MEFEFDDILAAGMCYLAAAFYRVVFYSTFSKHLGCIHSFNRSIIHTSSLQKYATVIKQK